MLPARKRRWLCMKVGSNRLRTCHLTRVCLVGTKLLQWSPGQRAMGRVDLYAFRRTCRTDTGCQRDSKSCDRQRSLYCGKLRSAQPDTFCRESQWCGHGTRRNSLRSGAARRRALVEAFLGNHGVSLPTLPLICSVLRTRPMAGPTEIAVGAPDFSFRKHQDGGFIITQRGALDASLVPDHLLLGLRYLPQLRAQRDNLRISLGKNFCMT